MLLSSIDDRGPSANAFGVPLTDTVAVRTSGLFVLIARAAATDTTALYYNISKPTLADDTGRGQWSGWYRFEFPEHVPPVPSNERHDKEGPLPELRIAGMDLITVTPAARKASPADAPFRAVALGETLYCLRPSKDGTVYLNRLRILEQHAPDSKREQRPPEREEGPQIFEMEPVWEARFRASGEKDVPASSRDSQSVFSPTGIPFVEPTIELTAEISIGAGGFDVALVPTADPMKNRLYIASIAIDSQAGLQKQVVKLWHLTLYEGGQFDVSQLGSSTVIGLAMVHDQGSVPLTPLTGLAPALAFYYEQDAPLVTAASAPKDDETSLQDGRLALAVPVANESLGLKRAMVVYDFAVKAEGTIPSRFDRPAVLVDGSLSGGEFHPDLKSTGFPTPEKARETIYVDQGLVVSAMVLGQVQPHRSPLLFAGSDGLLHLYFGGPLAEKSQAEGHWGGLVPGQPTFQVAQYNTRSTRLVIDLLWHDAVNSEQPEGTVRCIARRAGPTMNQTTVAITPYPGTDAKEGASDQPDLCTLTIDYGESSVDLPTEVWRGVPRELRAFLRVVNGSAIELPSDPRVKTGQATFFDPSSTLYQVRIATDLSPSGDIPGEQGRPPYAASLTLVSRRTDLRLRSALVKDGSAKDTATLVLNVGSAAGGFTLTFADVPRQITDLPGILNGSDGHYKYARPPGDAPVSRLITRSEDGQDAILFYPVSDGNPPDPTVLRIVVEPDKSNPALCTARFTKGELKLELTEIARSQAGFIAALKRDGGWGSFHFDVSPGPLTGDVENQQVENAMDLAAATMLFDTLLPVEGLRAAIRNGDYSAILQDRRLQGRPPLAVGSERGMLGLYALLGTLPESGGDQYLEFTSGAPMGVPVSGATSVWQRREPTYQLTFDGSNHMNVPVEPATASGSNLAPGMDWTFEAWVRPSIGEACALATYHAGSKDAVPGEPTLDYALSTVKSQSLQFAAVKDSPPNRRCTYLVTLAHRVLMLDSSFTWEFWVEPDSDPAPAGGAKSLGYALMVADPDSADPNFAVGLNRQRRVVVRFMNSKQSTDEILSTGVIPSTKKGEPVWTHVAVVVERTPRASTASISIIINGAIDTKTDSLDLRRFVELPQAYIGGVGSDDSSLAGRLASMRFWSTARSLQQIRNAAFQSVRRDEVGLSGLWSLDADDKHGNDVVFENLADSTKAALNATVRLSTNQEWKLVPNRFLLSFAAGVAGTPIEIGAAVLRMNRWNHIAAVYRSGGGLRLGGSSADKGSATYDYAIEENATTFGFVDRCAIDAWIQLSAKSAGVDNTIIARWSREKDGEEFELFVNSSGDLAARFVINQNLTGDSPLTIPAAGGARLLAPDDHGVYPVRHVAAVFELTNKSDGNQGNIGIYKLELFIDNTSVDTVTNASNPIRGQTTRLQIRTTQTPLTVGMRKPPLHPWEKMDESDSAFFKGVIGEIRVWSITPTWEQLFPERVKNVLLVAAPAGLIARWAFREQRGVIAYDAVREDNLRLSSSDLWTQVRLTSAQELYANGSRIWHTEQATDLHYSSQDQFTLGQRTEGGQGLVGGMTEVRIWREARTPSQLSENLYSHLKGDEANLTAYWSFDNASGQDQTGGGNDANPALKPERFSDSDAPVSNEGPEVRNTYGGVLTDFQVTTTIRPAVGELVAASVDREGVATGRMRRQYVYDDPVSSLPLPFKVGDLELTFIGQVQTGAKLIGYFEGAPPVPSENLTRPYYNNPAASTAYNGTSQVRLSERAETALSYSSASTTTSDTSFKGSVGPFWKYQGGKVFGFAGTGVTYQDLTVEGKFVVTTAQDFKWGVGSDNTYASAWADRTTDGLQLSGAWEPESEDFLNPEVGRRFVPDNLGSALVESLVADSFAVRDAKTGAMFGVILIPNLAIPPDRNIVTFPIRNSYTKQGTLDGKVGFKDDPSYPGADRARGSYFKPAEAYRLRGEIEQSVARDQAFYRQFDARGRGQTEFTANLKGVTGNLPVDFAADTVRRGLVNSYVWSADGGFHAEEQSFLARVSNTYNGFFNRSSRGGFDLESTFAFVFGMKGALSFSGGLQLAVSVTSVDQQSLAFDLISTAEGDRYLHAWRPDPNDRTKGAYTAKPTPGKVQTYRFMTFYEPPSKKNAESFLSILDPVWLARSTDAAAVTLRSADLSNPAWRVFHRVTYVERVPRGGSDEPVYSASSKVRAPANLMGNLAFVGLVLSELGPVSPTPAQIGRALQRVLNPPPDADKHYPKAIIEKAVPWWGAFLERARPGKNSDPAATDLLARIFTNALVYVKDSVAVLLRSTAINLSARVQESEVDVAGEVVVNDGSGATGSGAMVSVAWTMPEDKGVTQTAITGPAGIAKFSISGGHGTYTLTITNITKAAYVFDPAHAILSMSITM